MTTAPEHLRVGELRALLHELVTAEELRRLVRELPGGEPLSQELPGAIASDAELVDACVRGAIRYGIERPLFDKLGQLRPGRAQRISSVRALFIPAAAGDALADLLGRRLRRVFRSHALRANQLVDRRVRAPRSREETPAQDLPSRLSPGVNLLVGDRGLGKSAVLYQCGRALLERGQVVLCLSGPEDPRRAWDGLVSGTAWGESNLTHVLWDDFDATADSLDGILELAERFPGACVLAACSPERVRHLTSAGANGPTWRLLPLSVDDARRLLGSSGGAPSLIDAFARSMGEAAAHLVGNPLFIECVAGMSEGILPPQLPRVVARYMDERIARSKLERATAAAPLLALADLSKFPGRRATPEQLRDKTGVREETLEALTEHRLLILEQDRWYEFPHSLMADVLIARDRAERRAFVGADGAASAAERELSLLSVMFARPAIEALAVVAPLNNSLRLRALALLPHEEVPAAHLADAVRELVPLGDVEQNLDALTRCVDAMAENLSVPEAVGLLRALVRLESRDPEFLGLLLAMLRGLEAQDEAAATSLRNALLKHLPTPPPRPATSPLVVAERTVHLARYAACWTDLWAAFPGHQDQGQDPRLPVTRLSWIGATAFAAWWGARLPTNEEWTAAGRGMPRNTDDWQVANLPRTNADLGDGPIPVADERLCRDPGWRTWRQLIGNVREWCADSPNDAPHRAYARGGSYRQVDAPGERAVGRLALREDVGLRLCWDDGPR